MIGQKSQPIQKILPSRQNFALREAGRIFGNWGGFEGLLPDLGGLLHYSQLPPLQDRLHAKDLASADYCWRRH